MSFLTEYEDDIFISYAHNDNRPLLEGQRGWIDTFHQALESRLRVHLGTKPTIWRDPLLKGNEYFADDLVERIPKVAIMIAVLSPSYIASEWCRRETQLFSQVADQTGGIRFGNKLRIFTVERIPVSRERYPPELQGSIGYQFYDTDEHSHRAYELSPERGPEAIKYWQIIDDIAREIAAMLIAMRQQGGTELHDRPLPSALPREEYDVFISYRRQNGASEARAMRAELLRQRNIRAFLDVDDLGPGHFNQELLKRIADIPNFIVILSPNCLERCIDELDSLRQEIAQALKTDRKVVPVIVPGFQFPDPNSLPADLRALNQHQSVYYSHEYFDAMIAKVIRYLQQV